MAKTAVTPQDLQHPDEKPFRLGFLVHDVSRMRRTVFDQSVKPLSLTRSQWWILAQLSRHPETNMKQTDLARVLDVGKVTVGGLIDRLEASGHVERRADPKDRRSKQIIVTPKGYQAIEDMRIVGRELNEMIFAGIPSHHLKMAEDVLHQMKENIRDYLANGSIAVDNSDNDEMSAYLDRLRRSTSSDV